MYRILTTFDGMKRFGLIGYPLEHSFSRDYFNDKFRKLNLRDHIYENFPLSSLDKFPALLHRNEDLCGLNVTIPHKKAILPYLRSFSPEAAQIGAVNTIGFDEGTLVGYNTDYTAFLTTLKPWLSQWEDLPEALILGTGGGAAAVAYTLHILGIAHRFVSRKVDPGFLTYDELTPEIISSHSLIINTTPAGMYPYVNNKPPIPYDALSSQHFLYDLIYRPTETVFLSEGRRRGAYVMNGMDMLILQAEEAWRIWSESMTYR